MQAQAFTEVRTVNGVHVKTDAIAFRDGKNYRSGVALGPVVKVTKLTALTSRAYGFSGQAYSIKEYGAQVRHVSEHALVIVEGQSFKMSDFYAHVLTL